MQVNDKVVCVYASDCLNLATHGTYVVTELHEVDGCDLAIDVATLDGTPCGTYWYKRCMLESNVIKQVLENARNDR